MCRLCAAPNTPLLSTQKHRSHIHWHENYQPPNQNSSAKYRLPGRHRCWQTHTCGDSGCICIDICGHTHGQMPQLRPTSIAPLAPVHDLAVKHFCYHLASDRRKEKQIFQSHQASYVVVRHVSKSEKKSSKCWPKINCTWSPHAIQLFRSPHTKTLQWNQIRDQEEAMPETSSCWIYQLKRVYPGWPEQLHSLGKTAKEGHKGQYHLPG